MGVVSSVEIAPRQVQMVSIEDMTRRTGDRRSVRLHNLPSRLLRVSGPGHDRVADARPRRRAQLPDTQLGI